MLADVQFEHVISLIAAEDGAPPLHNKEIIATAARHIRCCENQETVSATRSDDHVPDPSVDEELRQAEILPIFSADCREIDVIFAIARLQGERFKVPESKGSRQATIGCNVQHGEAGRINVAQNGLGCV
jgi:hypothetical protein